MGTFSAISAVADSLKMFPTTFETYFPHLELVSASQYVVNSNAAQEGLSSTQPFFQLLEPVVALTEAVTVI